MSSKTSTLLHMPASTTSPSTKPAKPNGQALSPEPEVELKRDSCYDDPKAELILVSQGKVMFRVSAWNFAKRCQFAKHLMAVPSKEALDRARIPLDHNADVVRYFIDLVLARQGTTEIVLPIQGFHELFQLCDLFEAPAVAKGIRQSLLKKLQEPDYPVGLDPWEVFMIAANQDDVQLAKVAVKNLDKGGYTHRAMFQKDPARFVFADIPLKYAKAFYESGFEVKAVGRALNHSTGLYEDAFHWQANDLKAIGERFRLAEVGEN